VTARLPEPVTLTGRHVRLEPLTVAHAPDLFAAGGGDEDVWRWMPATAPQTDAEMRALVEDRLADPTCVPHAAIRLADGRAVGWSTYLDVPTFDDGLEIGWTWYGRTAWRTALNTEAKLLLLTHAFETLGFGRVQLKTDHLNLRSQQAIARLGAVREGVLRHHKQRPDGTWRDSVMFSILAHEWPAVRERLTGRLTRG
jgi:RimJ/RimL family protein N-acetyltransferase